MGQHNNGSSESDKKDAPGAPSSLALTIDYEKYLSQLEEWDVTEDQKHEFISILWNILSAFIDLGYGVHFVQEDMNADEKSLEKARPSLADMIYSEHTQPIEKQENSGGIQPSEYRKDSADADITGG